MFEFEGNELTDLSGFPPMMTYWLIKNNTKSLWDLIDRPKGFFWLQLALMSTTGENNSIDGYADLADLSCYLPGADVSTKKVPVEKIKGSSTKNRSTKIQRGASRGATLNAVSSHEKKEISIVFAASHHLRRGSSIIYHKKRH